VHRSKFGEIQHGHAPRDSHRSDDTPCDPSLGFNCGPRCLSSNGHKMFHGWGAVIATMRQTDQGACREEAGISKPAQAYSRSLLRSVRIEMPRMLAA
jgi:hypothetical protein